TNTWREGIGQITTIKAFGFGGAGEVRSVLAGLEAGKVGRILGQIERKVGNAGLRGQYSTRLAEQGAQADIDKIVVALEVYFAPVRAAYNEKLQSDLQNIDWIPTEQHGELLWRADESLIEYTKRVVNLYSLDDAKLGIDEASTALQNAIGAAQSIGGAEAAWRTLTSQPFNPRDITRALGVSDGDGGYTGLRGAMTDFVAANERLGFWAQRLSGLIDANVDRVGVAGEEISLIFPGFSADLSILDNFDKLGQIDTPRPDKYYGFPIVSAEQMAIVADTLEMPWLKENRFLTIVTVLTILGLLEWNTVLNTSYVRERRKHLEGRLDDGREQVGQVEAAAARSLKTFLEGPQLRMAMHALTGEVPDQIDESYIVQTLKESFLERNPRVLQKAGDHESPGVLRSFMNTFGRSLPSNQVELDLHNAYIKWLDSVMTDNPDVLLDLIKRIHPGYGVIATQVITAFQAAAADGKERIDERDIMRLQARVRSGTEEYRSQSLAYLSVKLQALEVRIGEVRSEHSEDDDVVIALSGESGQSMAMTAEEIEVSLHQRRLQAELVRINQEFERIAGDRIQVSRGVDSVLRASTTKRIQTAIAAKKSGIARLIEKLGDVEFEGTQVKAVDMFVDQVVDGIAERVVTEVASIGRERVSTEMVDLINGQVRAVNEVLPAALRADDEIAEILGETYNANLMLAGSDSASFGLMLQITDSKGFRAGEISFWMEIPNPNATTTELIRALKRELAVRKPEIRARVTLAHMKQAVLEVENLYRERTDTLNGLLPLSVDSDTSEEMLLGLR
ncbi:MAG: hypothetical protein AAFO91_02435, partial [Bacteroidota bacterium]